MELYHYTGCGLDYIWLKNGLDNHQTPYGDGLAVHNIFGLHNAIGRYLVCYTPFFAGAEIRFLRKEMDLSQTRLGGLLGTSESSIRNWENSRNHVNRSADRLLRLLYREHIDGDGEIRELIERISSIDRSNYHQRCELEETDSGWKAAA